MSKKRLYKKNIKTKKKIKGGFDGIDGALNTTRDNAVGALNAAGDNAVGALNAAGDNAINSAIGAVGATGLGAIANNPFVKFGKGALNAVDKFKKGLQILKGSLTQEDKYRHALLKLRNHSGFKNYFATAVNKVIVLNFYNVLIELGKYSRNYSDISKEIFEITGENMFDEDDNLYSELNEETSGLEETDCVQDPNINADKILSDKNIKNFLNDTMILCIPSIKENFKSLEKIIKDYKKLKGKMNGLLEKAERENNVEIYFDDFRILSDEAIKQINAIFNDFDTSKMSGGEEIDNIEDDFYDALLKMSIGNRDNFSKLLKEKLHGILNKIIKQLYDIANCKHVIDDNDYHDYDYDYYDMKFLEKTVETTDFNIEEFESIINQKIGYLKKKQESIEEKQSAFDKKAEENYDNLKEKVFRNGDATKKDNTATQNGGAKLFLPEALREEANAVSDSLSMVESQTEIQNENLEIVKFQKILIGIIKKMICKIQTNPEIDLDPFKTIVKPAFIEKKMQFRNLVKIWLKDFHEKRDLLIQLNEVLNKDSKEKKDLVTQESFTEVLETKEYMKKIQTQIDIAVKKQEEIKEYIKTKEEKQKEIDAEAKIKADAEAKIKADAEAKIKADAEAKIKADAKDEAEQIRISAENTKIKNELEQQNLKEKEKENIEKLNKEEKRAEDEINYGVNLIKAEQKKNAKLYKQKAIYAKQGLRSREKLDKDIQEKANAEIKKKQQDAENELKKEIDAKLKAEADEAVEIKNAAEKAKQAKEQLQNTINETNNSNIKKLIEKEKKEKEENEKRIKAKQKAERDAVINRNKNNLDPFAGGRPTRKFSSPVSRKTRRRRQTSL